MDPKSFVGALKTKTSIFSAITSTIVVIGLWLPVFKGGPITDELVTQTVTLLGVWLTIVASRQAVAKSGPTS